MPYHHIAFSVGAENGLDSVRFLVQLGNGSRFLINGPSAGMLGLERLLKYLAQPIVHLYAARLSVIAKALDFDVGGITSFRLGGLGGGFIGDGVKGGESSTDTTRACVVDNVVLFLWERAGHSKVDTDCN